MSTRGDLVERLWVLSERHTPGRVLVLVPHAVTARWLSSLLAERGVTLGLRIHDMETMLAVASTQLAGEPLSRAQSLAAVREALLADPLARYAEIAEQPSYQREVLRAFVELERGLDGARPSAAMTATTTTRDRAMLEVFDRFRERVGSERGWWRGQAPRLVLSGHRRVPFLHRRAAAVAMGFTATTTQWEERLLDELGFERWGGSLEPEQVGRPPLDLRLSCAGPEAEIAAVARLLREEPTLPAVVLAPRDALPRWVARLRHRDVPVRAWVEQRAANTAAARAARALLRILGVTSPSSPGSSALGSRPSSSAVRKEDLETVLFGPALRAWSSLADELDIDFPRSPHPGDLRAVWELQRASSFSLGGLAGRLHAAGAAALEMLSERAQRFGWTAELLDQRSARARDAHRLLAAAIEALDELARTGSPASLRELLDDWDLLGRAAVHGVAGPEMTAARVIVGLCGRARSMATGTITQLATELDHALAGASAGTWEQSRALGGGPPVWVLPYASVPALGRLPPRRFLTGLDDHPRPPVHHTAISDALRTRAGLVADRVRFTSELRQLDELVRTASGPVVGSWRHRDGAGSRRPPGPWIAGRQDEGRVLAVGVDAIALPTDDAPPSAPIEHRLVEWAADPELRRRVEAIRSHESPDLGPHTGLLGVRVRPSKPYSASALQRYAQLPYQYFVERVIGLRERDRGTDTAASLLASEQGQVVHRALELAHAARLAQSSTGLELASISEPLLGEVLDALAEGYRKRAEHGRAEAIWASERDRWAVELTLWWQRWQQRLREAWGGDASHGGSRRKPEPEQLVPGPFLLATEWSPVADDSSSFELDLGLRTIPFVAAIDRVEFDPPRQRIIIVDYKTGRPRWASTISEELRAGVHLQLPLYALALSQVVAAAPERLRLPLPCAVGALRLEYLQRPLAWRGAASRGGAKAAKPEARAFAPHAPLGVDASGQVWTVTQAAASFSLAFVSAIEAGHFPLVTRGPTRRGSFGASSFMDELARVIPDSDQRHSGLPPALQPLVDAGEAREVVQ